MGENQSNTTQVDSTQLNAGNWIHGQEVFSHSKRLLPVYSPETHSLIGHVPQSDLHDLDKAIQSAQEGLKGWTAFNPSQREGCFLEAARLLSENEECFTRLVIDEGGSTATKARFEWLYSIELFKTAAGEVRRIYGDTFPADRNDRLSIVIREPLGLVGAISPFNAPLALLVKMISFPLAGGNVVIAKPSEETPLVALELAKLLDQAGFPKGVFNVITGLGAEVGEAMVNDPRIQGITFTGSTTVGRHIASQAGKRLARLHLELGGKNPVIVLKDANLEEAARMIIAGAFAHAGQICMSSSRILVEEEISLALSEELVKQSKALHLGSLRDPHTVYGPLINQKAVDKAQAHLHQARETGAQILCGGQIKQGFVFEPTVVLNPDPQSIVWTEESFAPITCIRSFQSLDEAVALANDSLYGLSAGILSNDMKRSVALARRIQCGSVHIGAHSFQSDALAPIGGFGLSSLGRSGGKYSVEHFTELKWISFNLDQDL